MRRTLRRALAAAGTLCVIDHSNVVIHMDRIELTLLGAQGTSDTTSGADFLDSRSLVVGRALYKMLCLVRNKLDQMLRTCFYAESASDTFIPVNLSDPLLVDGERVQLAGSHAASAAQTAVAATGFPTIQ